MSTHDPPPSLSCIPGTDSSSSRNVVPFLGATKTSPRRVLRDCGDCGDCVCVSGADGANATTCAACAVTRATTPRLPTSLPSRQEAIRTVPPRTSARSRTRLLTSARRRPKASSSSSSSSFVSELWVMTFDGDDDVFDGLGSAKPARNAANARRRGSRRATRDGRSALASASASATASGGSAPRAPRTRSHVREACRATLEGDFVCFSAELPRRRAPPPPPAAAASRSSARSRVLPRTTASTSAPVLALVSASSTSVRSTYAVLAWRHPAAVAACVPESVSSTGIEPARAAANAPRGARGAYHGASVCAANAPRSDEGSRRERSSSRRSLEEPGLDAGVPSRAPRPPARGPRASRRKTEDGRSPSRPRDESPGLEAEARAAEDAPLPPASRRSSASMRLRFAEALPSGSGAPPPIADVSPSAADQAATRVRCRRAPPTARAWLV